jgi:hypothetical protein
MSSAARGGPRIFWPVAAAALAMLSGVEHVHGLGGEQVGVGEVARQEGDATVGQFVAVLAGPEDAAAADQQDHFVFVGVDMYG